MKMGKNENVTYITDNKYYKNFSNFINKGGQVIYLEGKYKYCKDVNSPLK